MNKEEVKDLITDMWKDELSKSGKWALEEYIKDFQSQLDIANKKLEDMKEYINYLVIFEPNIGRFNKTIWGEELLSIIGDKQ